MNLKREDKTTTWTLTKREMKALLAHTSKDATRPNLCVIYFDMAKKRIVTTDGHRLLRAEPTYATGPVCEVKGIAFVRKAFDDAFRVMSGIVSMQVDVVDGKDVARISVGSATLMVKKSGVVFPEADDVIPKQRPDDGHDATNAIGINAKYLDNVRLFAPDTTVGQVVLRLPTKPLDPILVTSDDIDAGVKWTCVIMPVRL